MLVQERDGVEYPIYYLSQKFLPNEMKFDPVLKMCVVMVWLIKKWQHYFQSYKVDVVSKIDPLKYLYSCPSLVGKFAKWLILLSRFDVTYTVKKVVKGRCVAEFLTMQTIDSDDQEFEIDLPDETVGALSLHDWRMHFDGVANAFGARISIILVTPENEILPLSKKLIYLVTNIWLSMKLVYLG